MNTLYIDTSRNAEIIVGLRIGGKEDVARQATDKQKAQVVLPLIDQLLGKHKLTVSDIHAIEVNKGPGSFTGLRVGISIANTLGYILKIPINAQKPGTFVEAVYT